MVDRLLAFIKDQKLFDMDDKLLLAVSGGIDSMVMIHLFERMGFAFAIAHCNFSLRGTVSDEDEKFIAAYAQSRSIPFFVTTFNTKKYATNKHISTQMAARELRYDWFTKLLAEHEFNYVLTAHHLNDSLETSLFNLTKGTGLPGLKGIRSKNNSTVRPLMFLTRDDIQEYAKKHKVTWREDSSNASVKYHRNLIRHEVIPVLRKINPLIENTFVNTARRVSESEEALSYLVDLIRAENVQINGSDVWIRKEALLNATITYQFIKKYEFNYSQAIDIQNGLNSSSGAIFRSEEYQINIDREHIIISTTIEDDKEYLVYEDTREISTEFFELKFDSQPYSADGLLKGNDASLDYSKLEFPLKVRRWKQGDKFVPLGMMGKKKVSDFMIDAKIPLNLKSRVFVVLSRDSVVWIVGYRVDNRFSITPSTKTMYNIKLNDYD